MPIPQTVLDLIQRFADNEEAYRAVQYNEAQVREEFITPFFAALGWDVYNRQGASERFKEVVHEASLKVAASTKAPDYAFRIGGQRVFFVEAKKPAVALKDDPAPAYQLRRYAWSAKLPLSILTDFEEFAVYDCRDKPSQDDKAATGRIFYCTYREYAEQWDYLMRIFAPEAITKGAFDRFAESTRGKRGTAEVDVAFLAEIEGWRAVLARNLALRNPGLSVRDLNFAVQQTIDRLIFLRIAEDRGIEPYQRLFDAAQGAGIYPRLCELFRQADNRYNSGLFHFRPEKGWDEPPDTFTLGLTLDDKVLKNILHSLYYPASPYQFDMLPADILGQVYEQFLGRVIRLTPGGQAKVEEKPEVKKAGGVYYTPTYIVDYIVQHTLGPLLEGKTPAQVKGSARYAPLRLLDPACGSGTFLIQAYQYLLDWYLEQYTQKDPQPGKAIQPEPGGGWRLTAEERKAILLRHLYGVDIDPQAVEVTKLSLLLKVLEGETEATLGTQLAMSLAGQDRVLPDLSQNIRCGNSLIGPDYYQGTQLSLGIVDEETLYRINAFDWEQGFHSAMMAGGFDAVIGNPPYIFTRNEGIDASQKEYFYSHYKYQSSQLNTFGIFLEHCHSLIRPKGMLGFITPNNWLTIVSFAVLRKFILENSGDIKIVNILDRVFANANVDTAITLLSKIPPTDFTIAEMEDRKESFARTVDVSSIMPPEYIIQISLLKDSQAITVLNKIESTSESLSAFSTVSTGLKSYQSGKGKPPQTDHHKENRVFHSDHKKDDTFGCYLQGADVCRYQLNWSGEYLSYGDWLAEPRKSVPFSGPRLLVRQIPSSPPYLVHAVFTDGDFYNDINSMVIFSPLNGISLKYLLGCINSRLVSFWFLKKFDKLQRKTFPQFKVRELQTFPIRTINFDDPADVARHEQMVALVTRMLDLHRQLPAAKTPQAVRLLQQQLDLTDQAIDALVYALYGLTAEEIAVVEGAGR